MTNKEKYTLIMEAFDDNDEIVDFCMKKIAAIDKKSLKAKEKYSNKVKGKDTLIELVKNALTTEYLTKEQILSKIDSKDITLHKLINRLSILAEEHYIVRKKIKIDNKEVTLYKLAENN